MPIYPGQFDFPHGRDRPIASLAQHILDVIVQTYSDAGVELPKRQLATIGSVAVDEPLLAVMFGGIVIGAPGSQYSEPKDEGHPRTATFSIELWRHTPTLNNAGKPPSASSITDAANTSMQDSWLLLDAVSAADQLGVGVVASATSESPQGGTVGVSVALDIQVP